MTTRPYTRTSRTNHRGTRASYREDASMSPSDGRTARLLLSKQHSGRAPNGASTIYQGKDDRWHGRVTMGVKDDGKPPCARPRCTSDRQART